MAADVGRPPPTAADPHWMDLQAAHALIFFSLPKKKTRPETVSCKFHCLVFYKYFRSRESMVGLPHSSGDRVVVSVVVAIHDPVENG